MRTTTMFSVAFRNFETTCTNSFVVSVFANKTAREMSLIQPRCLILTSSRDSNSSYRLFEGPSPLNIRQQAVTEGDILVCTNLKMEAVGPSRGRNFVDWLWDGRTGLESQCGQCSSFPMYPSEPAPRST